MYGSLDNEEECTAIEPTDVSNRRLLDVITRGMVEQPQPQTG